MKRGITLLEVIISIMVLMVGILGAATMLPLAGWYAAEANRYDRGATMVRRALENAAVHNTANPDQWIAITTGGPAWASTDGVLDAILPDMSVVMLDPLGLASNGNAVAINQVPTAAYALPGAPIIPRLTLTSMPMTQFTPRVLLPMQFEVARRRLQGDDDLQFSVPKDGSRPKALPGPEAEPEGQFSTAIMVRRRTLLDDAGSVRFEATLPILDAMVFEKRDFEFVGATVSDPPPECMVYADVGSTLPSGNLLVTLRSPTASWTDTKRQQPVLLSTTIADPTAPGGKRTFAQWYIVTGGQGDNVVLQGPDWPAMAAGWVDCDTSTAAPTVYATLFMGLALAHEHLAPKE